MFNHAPARAMEFLFAAGVLRSETHSIALFLSSATYLDPTTVTRYMADRYGTKNCIINTSILHHYSIVIVAFYVILLSWQTSPTGGIHSPAIVLKHVFPSGLAVRK
jgi:hypothetical protein